MTGHVLLDRFGTPFSDMALMAPAGAYNNIPESKTAIQTINKFGHNADVDTGGFEVLARYGAAANLDFTAGPVTVIGTTNDTLLGTGARTVKIQGVAADFSELSETVDMNGAGGVVTDASFAFVNRAQVMSVGTVDTNDGLITGTIGGTTAFTIDAGTGQTQQAIFTVPLGCTAYMSRLYASVDKTGSAAAVDVNLWNRNLDEARRIRDHFGLVTTGTSALELHYTPYKIFAEKSIIWMEVQSSANNSDIHGGFDLYLIEDLTISGRT